MNLEAYFLLFDYFTLINLRTTTDSLAHHCAHNIKLTSIETTCFIQKL